jgi:hypothetical protein
MHVLVMTVHRMTLKQQSRSSSAVLARADRF